MPYPTLSEKYELHKRKNEGPDSSRRADVFSLSTPLIYRDRGPKTASPPVLYKNYNRENSPRINIRKMPVSHINGDIQARNLSPIRKIPFTPSRLRPHRLYKVANEVTPTSPTRLISKGGILLNKRNPAKYAPKGGRIVHRLEGRKRGVFHRLRAFLSNFGLYDSQNEAPGPSEWEKFPREAASAPKGMQWAKNREKRVNFHDDANASIPCATSPKKLSRYNFEDDIDAVDDAMRKNEELQKAALLYDQIRTLRAKLEAEIELKRRSDELHKRELEEITASYESKIASMRAEVLLLEKKASARTHELEKSRLEELETTLFRKHEKHLIKQKEREDQLQFWEKRLETQAQEVSKKELFLDEKAAALVHIQTRVDALRSDYKIEQERLDTQRDSLDLRISGNKNDTIKFYEGVQRLSENILLKKAGLSAAEMRFLEDLHRILVAVGNLGENSDRAKAAHEYMPFSNKLAEYEGYFADFGVQKRDGYSLKRLRGVEEAFGKLRTHLQRKFARKNAVLSEVSETVSKMQRSLENGVLAPEGALLEHHDGANMGTLVHGFQRKSGLLFELYALNTLLTQLNALVRTLGAVTAKVEAENGRV